MTNQGGRLKLLRLTKRVKDLLQITKLYTVFEVYDDEAEAVARLNHPAIVHIYDIVETETGDWIVMELVDGRDLEDTTRHVVLLEGDAALDQGRPRAARRIDRGVGDRDRDQVDQRQGQPDRQRAEADRGAPVGDAEDDVEEHRRQDDLDQQHREQ